MGSAVKLIEAIENFINERIQYVREVTDDRHTDNEGTNDIHEGTTAHGADGIEKDSLDYLRSGIDAETCFEADCMDSGVLDGLESVLQFIKTLKPTN